MQLFQADIKQLGFFMLYVFGVLLSAGSPARAAQGSAVVSGTVRDAQGVGQMGALVQVLSPDSSTDVVAFTDLYGHYLVPDLKPGKYLVRATATLFLPATRSNLTLQTGAMAVVNLTLAALFDTASWLPAERRRLDEPYDDWKWTLRSTASRPILRVMDEGTETSDTTVPQEVAESARTGVRVSVTGGEGSFGASGIQSSVEVRRTTKGEGRFSVYGSRSSAAGASGEWGAGYESRSRSGPGSASRTMVSYASHPEIAVNGLAGLQVMQITSAQRMAIGDWAEVEAGGSLVAVRASRYGIETLPFVRMGAHLGGGWTLQYAMASDPNLQQFDDVTTGLRDIPVARVRQGRLEFEHERHQQIGVARRSERGTIEIVYYRDTVGEAAVSGGLGRSASGPRETQATEMPDGMVDLASGAFRMPIPGYGASGARVTVSTPVSRDVWLAAEYSTGEALTSEAGANAAVTEALGGLKTRNLEAVTIAMRGKLEGSGTRVRASYRWQPSDSVTAVDPYSAFGSQPFLSVSLRQPLRLGRGLPQSLDATIDVTNLLAEGYRPFLSMDGQTLYFAQAPRTIQAGLSFSF